MSLEDKIQYQFKNKDLLKAAITHKSFYNENSNSFDKNNERLEFLGDSVLGLSLSSLLMQRFSHCREGELSKMRASLVNETTLCEIAKKLNIDKELKLGQGEINTNGHQKPRLLSSAFEAVVGAVYFEAGFVICHEIIEQIFSVHLNGVSSDSAKQNDYKTQLQEKTQDQLKVTPTYKVIDDEGPCHDKEFSVAVYIKDKKYGVGKGRSKKQAEQSAAKMALGQNL